jgi:DNA-binding transcriptional LysR family regulator
VQLFVRDRRKVLLTEAGRAYLEEARVILERVDLAQQVVRQAGRGEIGSLSFGYEESTLYSIFPDVVRLYKERFPRVALDLREIPTAEQTEALLRGGIDVGLVQEPVTSEELRVETVLYKPLVAALPDEHLLADKPQVALEDLAEVPFVYLPALDTPGLPRPDNRLVPEGRLRPPTWSRRPSPSRASWDWSRLASASRC